uniref:complement subcomponent C1r n=1 Tax=Sparus aurata TaxID=8175 RepID=A0A671WK23_SPAAU
MSFEPIWPLFTLAERLNCLTSTEFKGECVCLFIIQVLHDQEVLGSFCGQNNSTDHPDKESILSPGNRLTLIFQTSDSTPELQQHTGFSATYKAIDIDECSKPDPGDGSYPLCSQICINTPGSYTCTCHSGYKLHLDQHTCLCKHRKRLTVCILYGPKMSLTALLEMTIYFIVYKYNISLFYYSGPFPGVLATNSSTVRLDYHTDNEGLSHGWSLDYSTYSEEVKCPFPGNVAKGRVTPTLTEYFYRDYIHVTCKRGYRLIMDGQKIRWFSAMCQSDGQWQLPLPECQLIDCEEPKPLLNGGLTFLSGVKNQYGSVVQYHCNEPFYFFPGGGNVSFTCKADGKWRSNHNDATLTCIPVCGKPRKLIPTYQRTVGGSEGPDNTIPWHVLLYINGQIGGGMVIADRWILTAAHILTHDGNLVSKDDVQISMGLIDVHTLLGSHAYAASIHIHPEYNNPNGLDYNNDIALIKLQDAITFNSSIMPICLPAEGATYVTDMIGLVSGFTIRDTDNYRILTDNIKYVHLLVVEQETCSTSVNELRKTKDLPSLTNNMFCAGVPDGGKDSCHGDRGSPLSVRDGGRFWAAGIVSWGVDCRHRGTYGIYTRVANYLDWINKTMQEK